MNRFEEACRPVLFEQKDSEFTYWGKGSSFLIASAKNYYWVTASHVLTNMGGRADSLRIFPSDNSKISLPFNQQYTVNRGTTDDEEYKDILVLRIDLKDFDSSGDAPLVAQDLEKGILHAERLESNAVLWVIGYPSEKSFIDYETREIKNTRSVLRAVYRGGSTSDHCHEMGIESSIKLENFDGLSGSPVFYKKQTNSDGEIVEYPLLVGMVLRGAASSGIAHFVSSNVIVNIVSFAENNS